MANNPFSGNFIRLDQIEKGLQEAKRKGYLKIEYSKIRSISEFLKELHAGKIQIAKYEIEDDLEKVRRECGISTRDTEDLRKIFAGEMDFE